VKIARIHGFIRPSWQPHAEKGELRRTFAPVLKT